MYACSCTHESLYCNLPKLVAPDNSQSDESNSNLDTALSSPSNTKIIIYLITEWSTQAHPVVITPCTQQAEPRVPLPQDPLGLFSLFCDDSLVQMIVDETNRYAEQVLQGTDKVWSTSTEEIRAYMGFMILMGINHLPEI